MQRLDSAVHDLGETSVLANVSDRQSCVADGFCRAPGGKQVNAHAVQFLRQIDNAAFVRDGKQSSTNGDMISLAALHSFDDVGHRDSRCLRAC